MVGTFNVAVVGPPSILRGVQGMIRSISLYQELGGTMRVSALAGIAVIRDYLPCFVSHIRYRALWCLVVGGIHMWCS